MFLASYEFDGDVEALLPAYYRLVDSMPPGVVELQLCVARPGGITVYDSCPSQQDFEAFTSGPHFAAAVEAAGLPPARIIGVGEVHNTIVGVGARP